MDLKVGWPCPGMTFSQDSDALSLDGAPGTVGRATEITAKTWFLLCERFSSPGRRTLFWLFLVPEIEHFFFFQAPIPKGFMCPLYLRSGLCKEKTEKSCEEVPGPGSYCRTCPGQWPLPGLPKVAETHTIVHLANYAKLYHKRKFLLHPSWWKAMPWSPGRTCLVTF